MDEIVICNFTKKKFARGFFLNIFKLAKSHLKEKKRCILSVVLVGKKLAQKLNKNYKNRNKPADVLTFVYKSSARVIEGEIVLCPKVIPPKDLLKYFIHGLLHYFGIHHRNQKSYLKMKKLEEQIIKKIKQC